ncbi:uncharacterized protein [Littorina saxatilis]|uniref:uncharacterized protein n=1 Tax=Littorina saxatilis TaxID=31220 RepID=UPI0038B51B0D
MRQLNGVTAHQCMDNCTADGACLNVEYDPGSTAVIETTTEITTLAETTPKITTLAETTPEITTLAESTPVITTLAETTPEITTFADTTSKANWLLAECSSDSQCTDTNTRCFVNQCMCIQGFYYSVSSKACIETCSSLDNTYLHYVSSYLKDYNLRIRDGVTLQQCLDDCNADGACLVVEYFTNSNQCNVQHVTAREDPKKWTESQLGWNFYQRNCQ